MTGLKKNIALLTFLLFLSGYSFGQINIIGTPFLTNFDPLDYGWGTQNWSVLRDSRGFMYFANNEGLLEFDGNRWNKYSIPGPSVIRSIGMDQNGVIYLGAYNELGMLKPDSIGTLRYQSLLGLIAENERQFENIWKIFDIGEEIVFQSYSSLLLLENDQIRFLKSGKKFQFSYFVNNRFFVQEKGTGLLEYKNGNLVFIPGSEIFSGLEIASILPYDQSTFLIGTRSQGLYLYDGSTFEPWITRMDDSFIENKILCGLQLLEDYFAFGTINNGVIIIDRNGYPVLQLNKSQGIQTNTILSMNTDLSGGLWLGLDKGIDYLETNSPFTNLQSDTDLGTGYVSHIQNKKLYLGTNKGLFSTSFDSQKDPYSEQQVFRMVRNTEGQVWTIGNFDGSLIVGHHKGTFIIKNNEAVSISDVPGCWTIIKLKNHPDYLIGGTYTGLILFKKKYQVDGMVEWKFHSAIKGFSESCRSLIEDEFGFLWMSHGYKGVYRITLNPEMDSVINYMFLNADNGLPSDFNNLIFEVNEEILISTEKGILHFNPTKLSLEPHQPYYEIFGTEERVNAMIEDPDHNIWYIQNGKAGCLKFKDDREYSIDNSPIPRINDVFVKGFEHINYVDTTNVLFGSLDGFVHYNPNLSDVISMNLSIYVRRVTSTKQAGKVVFGGSFTEDSGQITSSQPHGQIVKLPYRNNDISIAYSSPQYAGTNKIRYRYLLEGDEDSWSEWNTDAYRVFTNLGEGDYKFRVQSRNPYGILSNEAQFQFIIQPPWHRTILAFILYFIVILMIVVLIFRLIRWRIRVEKRRIEIEQKRASIHREQKLKHEILEAEKQVTNLKNDRLRSEIVVKSKELANLAMNIIQKNRSLGKINSELKTLANYIHDDEAKNKINQTIKKINKEIESKDDWIVFEKNFDRVHDDFISKIHRNYPQLTSKDLRLCAYLRMNLASKEIAPLLNISYRGVEISRYRLRKKLNLPRDANLIQFLIES